MKTIIAGSRSITSYDAVRDAIAACGWQDEITEVVCGMAKGVDTHGQTWAIEQGIPVRAFFPDWKTHGKAAGPIRNGQMADYADALILVWTGRSIGSANMLEKAINRGLRIYEHIVKEKP